MAAPKTKKRRGPSAGTDIGRKLIAGLRDFRDALASSEPLAGKFVIRTMAVNLKPKEFPPDRVRKTRGALAASQSVFAQLLGVSVKTVQSWEQGLARPSGMATRFLDEVQRNPDYWRKRLRESIGGPNES